MGDRHRRALRAAFVVTGLILWWRPRRTFEWRLWPARMSRPAIVRHHRDLGVVVAPLLLLSLVTGAVLVFRPMTLLGMLTVWTFWFRRSARAVRKPPVRPAMM